MRQESVIEIKASGAWNGGTLTDNSIYENKGMFFKGDIPVNMKSIEERIGIRTRMVAPDDARIGVIALQNLLETSDIDPSRIKMIIGATNVGEDKYDAGPLIRHPFETIKTHCPNAIPFDLYAGCPGYNVSVELFFLLSLAGQLKKGDISIVVGAENIHRAKAFVPLDTSNIIFGDDALATALVTTATRKPPSKKVLTKRTRCSLSPNFVSDLAEVLLNLNGNKKIDGIIIDNQLGKLQFRVPATAARLQHELALRMFPKKEQNGHFNGFKRALDFYNRHIDSFAFDIMSLSANSQLVENIATAYVQSGKYTSVVTIYLAEDLNADVAVHHGSGFGYERPLSGIVDTRTRTHGCFADYIQALPTENDVFGDMNGKGVFLYATRGARDHLTELLQPNQLTMVDIDLLIEHQANFAMIPMTLEKVLDNDQPELRKEVSKYVSDKMITNIHMRGNCSVVCMQRLPYDLNRGALFPDSINGYPINQNLEKLKKAKIILNDSVGAGMTRSSFLQIKNRIVVAALFFISFSFMVRYPGY
jgi:3-oxoacyl-[acyl-carrier-protein] synthase III